MSNRKKHHEEQTAVINAFHRTALHMGKKVTVRTESEVSMADMREVDCVVAMGGDRTFLRAAALITDRSTPILGINTNREVYTGVLAPHYIDYDQMDDHASALIEAMDDDHAVGFENRSRIKYHKER